MKMCVYVKKNIKPYRPVLKKNHCKPKLFCGMFVEYNGIRYLFLVIEQPCMLQ